MAKRNVVDFKIINLSEEKFQELKDAGQIDPNALYTTPDTTKERLDTLEATTVNYDNITNCITEIPQDIKLELNNGTLTLKAGSKVYVPNGVGVFDVVTIASDITYTYAYGAYTLGLYYNPPTGTLEAFDKTAEVSGETPTDACTFYNTSTNAISRINHGTVGASNLSFPIATITTNASRIVSIDQVFNGFGYIGSTIFALPGVKGLIPDGRNEDGTLKSAEFTVSSVLTYTQPYTLDAQHWVICDGSYLELWHTGVWIDYDEEKNINYNAKTGAKIRFCVCASTLHDGTIKVAGLTSKTAFHAVDYNDYQELKDDVPKQIATLLQTIYPVGAIYIGTQSTCPMSAVIPGSTWQLVSSGRALWTGTGSNGNTTIAAGLPNITASWFDYDNANGYTAPTGAIYQESAVGAGAIGSGYSFYRRNTVFNASRSNSLYGKSSTVQPPAYVVNVWRRTA